MKSKIYSSEYVKTTSKGQIWIPSFLALGLLMAFPVAVLLMLGNWSGMKYTMEQTALLYENLWSDGLVATGFIMLLIAAVINGVNSFWYLYSARKIDFYHSLPVRRSQMFWHKTYVGVLYYLIPYVIMEFFAICIGAMRGYFSLRLMGMALAMLILHLALYLMIYFSTVLVVCITGNILMGVIVFAGVFLYGSVLGTLITCYRDFFFATSYTELDYGVVKFLYHKASPYSFGKSVIENYGQGKYIPILGILFLVTAVLAFLAYLAYVKRPSESVQKPVIYEWIGIVMKFMAVIPCGLGIGLIFYTLPEDSTRIIWWIFGLILGTLLSHGIIEVLLQMEFRKFVSKKLHLAIAGALVAVLAFCYQKDLFRFDAYLPSQNEISGVNIGDVMQGEYLRFIKKDEDGTYQISSVWSEAEESLNHKGEVGNKTYQILQNIVETQVNAEKTNVAGRRRSMISDRTYEVPVKYTLKSGKEIYRRYTLTPKDIYQLYDAFYTEGKLKELRYSFLNIEDEYFKSVECTFRTGEYYSIFQNQPEKYGELLDALRADIADARAEDLLEQPCANLRFSFQVPAKKNINAMIPDSEPYTYSYSMMFVMPSFRRTVAILKETGYPVSMDDVLKAVNVEYYEKNSEGAESVADTVVYTDREELREFEDALVPSDLMCGWKAYESSIYVTFETQGQQDEYAGLLSEKLPAFVSKKVQELEKDSGGTQKTEQEDTGAVEMLEEAAEN